MIQPLSSPERINGVTGVFACSEDELVDETEEEELEETEEDESELCEDPVPLPSSDAGEKHAERAKKPMKKRGAILCISVW